MAVLKIYRIYDFYANHRVFCFIVIGCVIILFVAYNLISFRSLSVMTMEVQSITTIEKVTNPHDIPSVCVLPKIDPWDESIRHLITKWPPLKCDITQPYLTFLDYQGILRLNVTEVTRLQNNQSIVLELCKKVNCTYQEFARSTLNDDDVVFGKEQPFLQDIQISGEFVKVSCSYECEKTYNNIHSYIKENKINDTHKYHSKKQKTPTSIIFKPNVFIFGVDSMSFVNFRRQLPKTYDFLVNSSQGIVLKGMTKVGFNSFPNLVPFLTGRHPVELPQSASGFFDDWPIVWNNFSSSGYVTAFAEDWPRLAIFNYENKGFQNQPTDFYMRPYWLMMESSKTLFSLINNLCFGNIPKHRFILNWMKQFLYKFRDHNTPPYFAFDLLSEISHDYINQVQIVDDEFKNYIQELFEEGLLEETVLIVMGDHGNILDRSFTPTSIGKIEANMPFFCIVLPKKLQELYPHLRKNLISNSDRIVTWFDIHELLMDLAMLNLRDDSPNIRWGIRGRSPFRNIPERNCEEAGVPKIYCTCLNN